MIKKISNNFHSIFLKKNSKNIKNILEEDETLFQDAMRKVKPLNKEIKVINKTTNNFYYSNFFQRNISEDRSNLTVGYVTKKEKRAINNKKKIERVLDLHGYTVSEAEIILLNFVKKCFIDKKKIALIITGKGRKADCYQEYQGVLQQFFLSWVKEKTASRYIISYSVASSKHGGEGAFYILLRSK